MTHDHPIAVVSELVINVGFSGFGDLLLTDIQSSYARGHF